MRLLIKCPFVSEIEGVTLACCWVDISAHSSWDVDIHLAKSWCCSGCIHMWLLEQGACHAMHCDSMHSALITGYNTAHSFGGKMLRKLGRGSPLVWIPLSTIIVKQSLVYLFYYLCTSWNYSNREQTLVYTISTRTDPGYRYIVQQTLVHTMCCPRIHDNIEWVPRFTIIREWSLDSRYSGISRVRGLVQSPVSRYFTSTIMQNTLLRCNAPALQGWYNGQCQPALQTSCRPQEAWQRL